MRRRKGGGLIHCRNIGNESRHSQGIEINIIMRRESMKKNLRLLTGIGIAAVVAGCVSKPQPVPFEEAMEALGKGFVNMHNAMEIENGKQLTTGLIPSEAQVSFAVSSVKDKNGNIKLAVSPLPAGSPVSASAEAGYGAASKSTVANTISVSFKTIWMGKTTNEDKTEKGTGPTKEVATKTTIIEGAAAPGTIEELCNMFARLERNGVVLVAQRNQLETMLERMKNKEKISPGDWATIYRATAAMAPPEKENQEPKNPKTPDPIPNFIEK
jgi:hypothetical protein